MKVPKHHLITICSSVGKIKETIDCGLDQLDLLALDKCKSNKLMKHPKTSVQVRL